MIYMFLSNNPSSGDINSSNLFRFICNLPILFLYQVMKSLKHVKECRNEALANGLTDVLSDGQLSGKSDKMCVLHDPWVCSIITM